MRIALATAIALVLAVPLDLAIEAFARKAVASLMLMHAVTAVIVVTLLVRISRRGEATTARPGRS